MTEVESPTEEVAEAETLAASRRFESKYGESARLQAMMAAPKGRFESGVHEQWSGDLPIRCVSCGSVHLYSQGGNDFCQYCQTKLPLDQWVPVTKTCFTLSLEGEFVRADSAWEKITVSKMEDARGKEWIHRIDPSFFAVLDRRWVELSHKGGELVAKVTLTTQVGSFRKARLRLVHDGPVLSGEITLIEESSPIRKVNKRHPIFGMIVGGFAALLVLSAVIFSWTIKSELVGAAVSPKSAEEGRASLYSVTSLDKAVALVDQFHTASTPEEKARHIIPFASMRRDLGFHYAVGGNEPKTVAEYTRRGFHRSGDRLFCAVQGRYDNSEAFLAMVEVYPGQIMKLDWHAFTGTGDLPWRDFLMNTPTHEVTMRLLAKPDDFYGDAFKDSGDYLCYRLTDIEGELPCYGYVNARSEVAQELADFFGVKPDTRQLHGPLQASIASGKPAQAAPKRVTLRVQAPPKTEHASNSGEVVQVLISDLIHLDWVGPKESDSSSGQTLAARF